ncbi:glycosyltransferase family 4 protein [uncultured Arthrobacter sp.]|uniref:glycosyltransferase family 4 protein n=1 Tax=uncultured Arthrobacter sp. TaxID=114050 RepID=UPI0028D7FEBF|nr:glycosyltransferase family 4 protein [uncultured Arthrobacter sp.]
MMRVAYICADPGVPVFGTKGSSVHVQEIVRAWRRAGAEVTVYCTRTGTDRPADLAGLPVVEIRPRSAAGTGREHAVREAADALAQAVIRDGCDVLYERYSLFSPALALAAGALRVPAVLEVNAPLIEEQQQYRELHDAGLAERMLHTNAAAASVVACVSEPVVRWVEGRVPGARTRLAPNGVNTERITPRLPVRDHSDRLTVAFVGTLKPWHGVGYLLEAVAQANIQSAGPTWRAKIIGDGPCRQELEWTAAGLGVDAEFTGAVAPDSVPGLLHECDAAAAPYPATEPGDDYFSPLKVYEYLAAGLPVIASGVGQIPSILQHERTGLLVKPADPGAIAAALGRLGADAALRERLGTQARAAAVGLYSWDSVLATIRQALAFERSVA